jgi:hypothetical protein
MDWLKVDKYPNPKDGRYIVCISEDNPGVTPDVCEALRQNGVWYYAPVNVSMGEGEQILTLKDGIEKYDCAVTHYMRWPEHPSQCGYYSQGLNPSNES